jgi:catechol 2,3-dioxygenase-like lactoylglutathione lyase family enzyme
VDVRLSLVTLGVSDLECSIRFYANVLGLPRLPSPPTIAFFELGKTWSGYFADPDGFLLEVARNPHFPHV